RIGILLLPALACRISSFYAEAAKRGAILIGRAPGARPRSPALRIPRGGWLMPSYAVTQGKEEASVVHIAVCIKQIIDPEIPPRSFAVDRDNKEAVRGSASLVIGPFDLNAMEVAVQLKERHGGKITVISVGTDETKEALKRALAMGGDEAVLVQRPEGVSSQPAA